MKHFSIILVCTLLFASCQAKPTKIAIETVKTGAENSQIWIPLLQGKKIGLTINNTSTIEKSFLPDTMLALGLTPIRLFSPEHGIMGNYDAGATVKDDIDGTKQLPIISLYGKNKKPTKEQLRDIEIMVFDIQDVGVRFYTYISTMHYVMEACAENNIPVVIFDRPNPNADIIDGPVLEHKFKSFIGMHPIPIVYGMTIGELAKMINGEGWLNNAIKCDLTVIACSNYTHNTPYQLPIKPSPNLPTYNSVRWYPSLCLFEGTCMSIGRGTNFPFEVIGYPNSTFGTFSFTPISIPGMATTPDHQNKTCFGVDLRDSICTGFSIKPIINFANRFENSAQFFKNPETFDLLAGNNRLRNQISNKVPEKTIIESWQKELEKFKIARKKYLIYP